MITLNSASLAVRGYNFGNADQSVLNQDDESSDSRPTAVIVDCGVFKTAAGYSDREGPPVIFRSLVAKMKREKSKEPEALIGSEIPSLEAARTYLKLPFERNVVTNGEAYEAVVKHALEKMDVDLRKPLKSPILLMEPLCNPKAAREIMADVLMDGCNAKSIAFGVDAAFAYYYACNGKPMDDALIISLGHVSSHVIPFVDGKIDTSRARRLAIGGYMLTVYLQRAMQLKYPAHAFLFSFVRAEELLYDHCYVSESYLDELRRWADSEYYQENVKRIETGQLPQAPPPGVNEALKEKRKELGKKLAQMQRRRRAERLAADVTLHAEMLSVKESLGQCDDDDEAQLLLEDHGFASVQELNNAIKKLGEKIDKESLRMEEATKPASLESASTKMLEPPEGENLESWLIKLQSEKEEITNKRNARRQKRALMAKRRTAAGQERMRIISQLAARQKEKDQDDFGARDEDWDVYKAIRTEGGSDSEAEGERLTTIETLLTHHGALETPKEVDSSIHFGNERIRTPEILFQPSISGIDQMGISELTNFVISRYDESTQMKLAKNVFVTGGMAAFQGLEERIRKDIQSLRPFQSEINVTVTREPGVDCWKGAQLWFNREADPSHFASRDEYLRGELIGEKFFASNKE